MFNWETRIEHIAEMIKDQEIDIVAFQEVRSTDNVGSITFRSQLDQFKTALPEYKWTLFVPAGPVSSLKDAYRNQWSNEGLGILSRRQIVLSSVIKVTKTTGSDPNPRSALQAQIRVGPSAQDLVKVIAVHFSYDRHQQCQNAIDIIKAISATEIDRVVILGDFNAYKDFTGPVDLFTMKRSSSCSVLHQPNSLFAIGCFRDAWLASGHKSLEGLTFSNMPTPGLQSRPDRILVSKNMTIQHMARAGDGSEYKKYYHWSVIISRAKSVLRTSYDAFMGQRGYSCVHDCGPHGSCRCGICVSGGNEFNCAIPQCPECTGSKFILLLALVIPLGIVCLTFLFSFLKILVVTSNFTADDVFEILGYRCCLFNKKLFSLKIVPRNYKLKLNKLFLLCHLPPVLLMIVMLICLTILLIVCMCLFYDSITVIYAVLPEEMFPSDHQLVFAKLIL